MPQRGNRETGCMEERPTCLCNTCRRDGYVAGGVGTRDAGRYELNDAEKLLRKWQKRLGLSDWCIKLQTDCLPDDMTLQNCAGCTSWQESIKAAVIQLLAPECYGKRIVSYDIEKTLIHELLHLKLALLGESGNDLQDRLVHQLIDDLARAFVETGRNGG